jgi:hypothetical protein
VQALTGQGDAPPGFAPERLRRRPGVAFARLRQARWLVVAIHLPPVGTYRLPLPVG